MTARYTRGILAVAGHFAAASFLQAQSPLQIDTNSLPPASVGVAYNQQIVTSGGKCSTNTGSPSATIDAGALPQGLAVTSPASTRQWSLQGTPTAGGNFTFTVHVFWAHTQVGPFDHNCTEDASKTLTLSIQGNGTSTLVADRSQITTAWHTGQLPPNADSVRVSFSGGGAVAITAQSVTDSGGPWLSVTPQNSTTPATLSIGYSVSGLTAGMYTGRVTVTTGGAPALIIPVTLQVVAENNTQTLNADRSQIAATWHIGTFPPGGDMVTVSAAAGGAVPITVQAVTDSGGPWLNAAPPSSTTPAPINVSYSISGLTQGTYIGRVIVTAGGQALTIPVTLQVVADAIQLKAAPTSLAFTAAPGGSDPPAQSIIVTVAGLARLFQATVSVPAGGKQWLSVTPSAAATEATLSVAVTAKDLGVGVYNSSITLAVGGLPNSAVSIPVTFSIQAPAQKPTISAGGVVDAAGGGRAIAPGTWVSIFGTALATTTRPWRDADFVSGRLPTALDGVSVTINGKPAAVAFISPIQINVLAADDTATGLVAVQVKNAVGTSDSVLTLQQTAAPAFFQFSGTRYAAGIHGEGGYLAGGPGTPAKAGETIVLFGTGFGATAPPIPATSLVPEPRRLAHPEDLRVRIGGLDATIAFAGLISPGVYQFNLVVPQVGAGDQPVTAELRGLLTQSGLLLTVQ